MVEGGKIDWACHSNDGATMVNEVMDFSDAVEVVLEFYHQHPDETLVVVTADHETSKILWMCCPSAWFLCGKNGEVKSDGKK